MTNLSGANLNNGAAVGPQGEGRDSPSTFSKYPAYKDSGVEWLEEVPGHWYSARFSRVVMAIKDGTHGTYERVNEGVPLLSAKNVQNGFLDISERESLISEADSKDIVSNGFPSAGDLLLTIVGTIGRSCVYTAEKPFAFQRSVCFIRLHKQHCPYFFYYFSQSKFFQEQLAGRSKSSAQAGVYMGDVVATSVVFPPDLSEQTQIARFLNHETARIDALIEEQQRLIELLKEKRQAVISYAVTKGLDPTVPMKDSGVEWLGEVPAHWVVSKFGYISSVVRGGSPRPAGDPELFNGDFSPWVTVAEITKDDEIYLEETETFLTKKGSDQCRIFSKGTLLLSNSGATLGVPKILMIKANANDGVVGFENISLNKEYSYFYLSTLTQGLRDRAAGSGQPNLNTDVVKSIDVPIPPANEVAEIVAAVRKLRAQFHLLSKAAADGVKLLQERRSALISAAVTGKIDVRGWQPPASAPTPELEKEAV
jgi:type I restriction enzyme S subunit